MSEIIILSPSQLDNIIEKAIDKAVTAVIQAQQQAITRTPKSKYLSKKEAAEMLRITSRTVEHRMAAGILRYLKEGDPTGKGKVRILAEDVYRLMNDNTIDNRFKKVG